MWVVFIKDYKYNKDITIHKKGDEKFIADENFAKYLLRKHVAIKKPQENKLGGI